MRHFVYRSLDELARDAAARGCEHVQFEPDAEAVRAVLTRRVQVGTFTVGNSIAIHPMEGCDGTLDGRPGELTLRRYQRFAAGGAKLLWLEATAVRNEGRANPRQLLLTSDTAGDYARLIEMIRRIHRERCGIDSDLLDVLQLTHSGRYSVPSRILAVHNPGVDAKYGVPPDYPVISDDELERLEDSYVQAATLAADCGFRAIDLKVTHGYLLSELIGAKTREGRYGGSLENRVRFMRNVLGKIRAALGSRLILCMRLGCYEGVPFYRDDESGIGKPYPYDLPYRFGLGNDENDPMREDLTETKQAIAWFIEDGLSLLNISIGSPYFNPHIGRPFEKPDEGNYEPPEHPLEGVDRHFRIAAALQCAFPALPMIGTGYSWLQKYAINAGAWNVSQGHIRFFGMGRNALAYPDFARAALEQGELDERQVCKTVTYCTYLMRQKHHPTGQYPTGCPPFDKEVYGPIVKEARATKRGLKD